jgi:CRISPR/Cas system-associated exonuclease Cas4 (RecB family)
MSDKLKNLKLAVLFILTLVACFRVLWLMMKALPDERKMQEFARLREAMIHANEKKSVRKVRDYLLRRM